MWICPCSCDGTPPGSEPGLRAPATQFHSLEGQRWWSSTAPWDWATGPFGSPPQAEATVPLSFSQYQANTLLYEPTPSPFGDYGRNGSLFSGRAYPSRSPALDPARAGLSRCRGLRVKRRPALGPSCGAGPGREERVSPARGAVGFGPGPRLREREPGLWCRGLGLGPRLRERDEQEPRGCGLGSNRIRSGVWWCPGPVGPTGSDPARGLRAYTDGVSACVWQGGPVVPVVSGIGHLGTHRPSQVEGCERT